MIALLWVVLSITVAVLVQRQWQKKVKFAGALPRAKPYYPVVGNLPLALGKSPDELFSSLYECFRQHDRLFTLQFSTIVAVCLSHPELIQRVLNHPDCQEKPDVYKVVRLPKGLLAARYDTWKVHRKTLNSTFNTKILQSFLSIFNNSSRRLIGRLKQYADSGTSCNILEYISECTLEMICRTSLGGKALERDGRQDFIENLEVRQLSSCFVLVDWGTAPCYCGISNARPTQFISQLARITVAAIWSKLGPGKSSNPDRITFPRARNRHYSGQSFRARPSKAVHCGPKHGQIHVPEAPPGRPVSPIAAAPAASPRAEAIAGPGDQYPKPGLLPAAATGTAPSYRCRRSVAHHRRYRLATEAIRTASEDAGPPSALTALGKRILSFPLHNDFIYQFTTLYRDEMKAISTCHQFTDKIIAEKHVEIKSLFDERETLEDGETIRENDEAGSFKRPQIFIDQLMKMPLMMKDAYSFSDQEISDHVYTMIVAGNETSATQLAHTCLLLAMNPESQEKAYQEVKEVVTSPDMFFDMDTLKQLVYVEAVLKEAMRMIPVAPLIARENIRDIVLDGHLIPKGTVLLMNMKRNEGILMHISPSVEDHVVASAFGML
ncbi:hypothetical protein RP20_CCG013538 [Aedes albopictus]|nr:hypothetical protein RP20_CCG013538 [Aedes albopictus]